MISTITASSENKTEAYELLVALHTLAVKLARLKGSGWYISSSYTNTDEGRYLTAVSNGAVEIVAESIGTNHRYEKRPVK